MLKLATAIPQQLVKAGTLGALLALSKFRAVAAIVTEYSSAALQPAGPRQSDSSTEGQQTWPGHAAQQDALRAQPQRKPLLDASKQQTTVALQQSPLADGQRRSLFHCSHACSHSTLAAGHLASAESWGIRSLGNCDHQQPYTVGPSRNSLRQLSCQHHSTQAGPDVNEPGAPNSSSHSSNRPPQLLKATESLQNEQIHRPTLQQQQQQQVDNQQSDCMELQDHSSIGSSTQQQRQQQQQPPRPLGVETHQQQQGGFASLGVPPELVKVLKRELQIVVPTPVQEQAMQPVAAGRHVAIQSPTGTGKTLAWLLPLMSGVKPWDIGSVKTRHGRVLVVAPTQELCMQIVRTARSLIPTDRKAVMPLMGGSNISKALKSLNKARPWLIVATPGRLKKIMNTPGCLRKVLPNAQGPQMYGGTKAMTIVLEEAPKLLAMDDMKEVLEKLAPETPDTEGMSVIARILNKYQTVLVSASLKPSTLAAAPAWAQANPVMISAPAPPPGLLHTEPNTSTDTANTTDTTINPATVGARTQMLPSTLTHHVITYDRSVEKLDKVLRQCLRYYKQQGQKVLVFVGEQSKLLQLDEQLSQKLRSIKFGCVYGRMAPQAKVNLIRQFNRGELDSLLVSDAFSLGLDFEGVDVVMQVGLPASQSQYSHRAGRCGRMGRKGTVLTLVADDKVEQLQVMLKRMKIEPMEMRANKCCSGSMDRTIAPLGHGAS